MEHGRLAAEAIIAASRIQVNSYSMMRVVKSPFVSWRIGQALAVAGQKLAVTAKSLAD